MTLGNGNTETNVTETEVAETEVTKTEVTKTEEAVGFLFPKAPWNSGYYMGNYNEVAQALLKALSNKENIVDFEMELLAIQPFLEGEAYKVADALLTPHYIIKNLQSIYPVGHPKHEGIGAFAYDVSKYIGCDGYDILIETLMSWKVA